jgi:hypothetical protein
MRPQVFVAMSFAPAYEKRYANVIVPAVERLQAEGVPLKPYRVDLSKSGDSILSDIVDGIAHSRLVLADVSAIGYDAKDGTPYRNGNVMYELGVALASRDSSDVLLIRDDKEKFLFDVSTIPHMHIDFSAKDATDQLATELNTRLREQNFLRDARCKLAMASMGEEEAKLIAAFARLKKTETIGWKEGGALVNMRHDVAVARLMDKHLITASHTVFTDGEVVQYYRATELGSVVAKKVLEERTSAEALAASWREQQKKGAPQEPAPTPTQGPGSRP